MTDDKKDAGYDDIKGIVALIVLVAYIIFSVWGRFGFSFSISSVMALISFFIALFGGIRVKENDKKGGLDTTAESMLIIWFILFGAWISNFWPDWSGRLMFWMFIAAISTSMKLKDIILFFGLSLLTGFFFESGILATLVLIATAFFAYACRQNAAFGAIMMVPLLIVGWLVGSGYGTLITQKVDSFSTQISSTTGISTEGVGSGVYAALNNTWLMLTDPNKWYEKQFVDQGTRDVGMTAQALEITKIEALPNTVTPMDTFDIVFEMENKGTVESESVNISAHAGDDLAAACGKINGKYCLSSCSEGTSASTCTALKPLGSIAAKEKRFDSFTFQAPECPGTYSAGGRVIYSYEADATISLQMIAREYYEDLLRNNQMKWIDELSTASSGPFKVTLRTDRQQPIPDRTADDKTQGFKIYLGLINEHEGIARLKSAALDIPVSFEIVNYLSEETIDSETKIPETTYDIDKSCTLTYDATMTVKECDDATNLKCSDDADTTIISFQDISIAKDHTEYLKISKAFKEKATTENGIVHYKPINLSTEMNQNDWKYYKCGFQLEKNGDGTPAKLSQIETMFLRTHIDYNFEYTKDAVVTVRQAGAGLISPKCQENVKKVSAIDASQTTPQEKDAIITDLADKIDSCWKNSDGWFADDNLCGAYKVDITGCSGNEITGENIRTALNKINSDANKNQVIVTSVNTADEKQELSIIKESAAECSKCNDPLFNDRYTYTNLEIWYSAGDFELNWDNSRPHIKIYLFDTPSNKQVDTTDCKGKDEICDTEKGNCQEGFLCSVKDGDTSPTCQSAPA